MVVDEQRRIGTPAEGLQAQGAGTCEKIENNSFNYQRGENVENGFPHSVPGGAYVSAIKGIKFFTPALSADNSQGYPMVTPICLIFLWR